MSARLIGIEDFAAAETLASRELREGNFLPTERQLLYRLLDGSIRIGRTRLYVRRFEELCEIMEQDQKKLYGYLNPLLRDFVMDRSPRRLRPMWFAINPPHRWKPDRRGQPDERVRKLFAELADYDPLGPQNEFWDWPSLDEMMRQEFLQTSTVTQTPGAAIAACAGHSRSGTPDSTPGLKDGSRESGSAESTMLAPAGSEDRSPSLQPGAQHAAPSAETTPAQPWPILPPYHQTGGMGPRQAPSDTTSGGGNTDTTKRVVWADTTKKVVCPEPAQASDADAADPSRTRARHSTFNETENENVTNVERLRAAGRKCEDTTKPVVSRRVTCEAEEQRLMGLLMEFLGKEEMRKSGKFWRTRVVRNFPDALERAIGEGKYRVQTMEKPFRKSRGAWLNNEAREYAGIESWSAVAPGPAWHGHDYRRPANG